MDRSQETRSDKQPRSILVLRLSSLGDILHALPAVSALRRRWPQASIGWVVERRAAVLLRDNPLVDDLHLIDTYLPRRWRTLGPGISAILRLIMALRRKRYDLVLDFQGLFKSAVIAWLSGARRRIGLSPHVRRERFSAILIGEHAHPPVEKKHIIDVNNCLAEKCGASTHRWEFPLPETKKQAIYVRQNLDRLHLTRFIVMSPGAGWVTKMWSAQKYGQLSRLVYERLRLPTVFIGAPSEYPLLVQIEAEVGSASFYNFPTTFLDLIPLLSQSSLFVGGDTGPMQLAASLRVPIVGIFGASNPERNGPFSPDDVVVHHQLHCSNCYNRHCPYHLECMDISVAEVLHAVEKRLACQNRKQLQNSPARPVTPFEDLSSSADCSLSGPQHQRHSLFPATSGRIRRKSSPNPDLSRMDLPGNLDGRE